MWWGLRGRKYQPLADFLTTQPSDEVTLSFAQITALVGVPPPLVASRMAWWTSNAARRRPSQSWRAAGWEVTAVTWRDDERWVTFRRRPASTPDNGAG